MMTMRTLLFSVLTLATAAAAAAGAEDIINFREYSPAFASAGQPTAAQLEWLSEQGFERVVYIAWSDQEHSLPHEDRLVKSLGMEYLHIPVDWNAPTPGDFYLFAGAMQRAPARKTLLHCQVNARASAFSFLYRVLYMDVPVAEAKRAMNTVWAPNDTWRRFIFDVLEDNGVSPQCDGCDWSDTAPRE